MLSHRTKLGEHDNSPVVWISGDVQAWFLRRGIQLPEDSDDDSLH